MADGPSFGWGKALAKLSIAAGGCGMFASFLYLASRSMEDIVAGASGFIAGAILIGAGLISLALFSLTEAWLARASGLDEEDV